MLGAERIRTCAVVAWQTGFFRRRRREREYLECFWLGSRLGKGEGGAGRNQTGEQEATLCRRINRIAGRGRHRQAGTDRMTRNLAAHRIAARLGFLLFVVFDLKGDIQWVQ
jgi:hypothetical protein